MSQLETVSVIVVNFNGGDFVVKAIESLLAQTRKPDQIIVVDNASTDGSVARMEAFDIDLLLMEQNVGFAEGCNQGLKIASGNYIALLNSDAEAHSLWIDTLVAALLNDPTAAAAVGKIYISNSRVIDQAGALFNQVGNYWGRGHGSIDSGQFEISEEVPGITACATVIRRSALREEDLFDGSLFMYGEELDLSIRLRNRGMKVIYEPDAVVWHEGMKSVQSRLVNARLFQQTHSNRNRLKILAKYYPLGLLIRNSILIVLGVLYWDLRFLRHDGPRKAWKTVRQQMSYVLAGLVERKRPVEEGFVKWITSHSFRGLIKQKRRMEESSTVKL